MASKQSFYNGNSFLPKAGTPKEFSGFQLEELMKCAKDPVYFAETYFKIVHQDKGLIQMELYQYQKKMINLADKNRNVLMAASRQCGKTSVATVVILHAALFNEHKTIALLANKMSTAQEILERIKTAYEYLPDWLKGGVKEWNKRTVIFENGSRIIADASQGDSIRGKSIYLLYVDECVAGETQVTVRDKNTGKIFQTSMKALSDYYKYKRGEFHEQRLLSNQT